jgi:hypothetical protein
VFLGLGRLRISARISALKRGRRLAKAIRVNDSSAGTREPAVRLALTDVILRLVELESRAKVGR